jgi:hypothetical protein
MGSNTSKFRLRLNLFDGIVLVLALAAGAFLLWSALKPEAAPVGESTPTSTIRYTVRFQRWLDGTGTLVEPGDQLVDNIKNNELGNVVSAQVIPSQSLQLDQTTRQYVLSDVPGYIDVDVVVEATGTASDEAITLSSGYVLRVGATLYIRGEGYMASGPIIAIEREG